MTSFPCFAAVGVYHQIFDFQYFFGFSFFFALTINNTPKTSKSKIKTQLPTTINTREFDSRDRTLVLVVVLDIVKVVEGCFVVDN